MDFDGKKFCRAMKNFRHAKPLKNFPRKILRRGIFLRKSLQLIQVAMIEFVKDFVQLRLENFEVDKHSELVQIVTANNRFNLPIMTVQPRTFAGITVNKMRSLERRANIYLIQNFSSHLLTLSGEQNAFFHADKHGTQTQIVQPFFKTVAEMIRAVFL